MFEVYNFKGQEPQSAFVDCTIVVYFPEGINANWWQSPSYSFWIVPGTTED